MFETDNYQFDPKQSFFDPTTDYERMNKRLKVFVKNQQNLEKTQNTQLISSIEHEKFISKRYPIMLPNGHEALFIKASIY